MGPWHPINRWDLAKTQVHWLVVYEDVRGTRSTSFVPLFERPTYGSNERQRMTLEWPVLVLKVTPKCCTTRYTESSSPFSLSRQPF